MQIRIRVPRGFAYFCVFEFFDECSEMRRHGSRLSVVLVPQESPNDHEGGSPIASGVHVALRKTRGNVPAYPVIDSISCDGGLPHGAGADVLRLLFRAIL